MKLVTITFSFTQELPKQTVYHPPLTFTVKDQQSFGRSKYVGTHIQHSVSKFLISLDTKEQHAAKLQSVIFPPPIKGNFYSCTLLACTSHFDYICNSVQFYYITIWHQIILNC